MKRDVSDPAGTLTPALLFLREIWALNHAIEQTSMRMESALGVTAQQRMMVRVIGRFPGITGGEIAKLLHVDAGTISAAVRRLEARGLVKRKQDLEDRRRVSLALTAQGRRLDVATEGTVESAVEAVLAVTTEPEREGVRRVLVQLVEALQRGA